jgi:hypothetical protein
LLSLFLFSADQWPTRRSTWPKSDAQATGIPASDGLRMTQLSVAVSPVDAAAVLPEISAKITARPTVV